MKTTYELKNATFTVDEYSAAELRALEDEQLLKVGECAEAYWSYRKGARKESDGKHFSLADMVKDMMTVGARPGKITPADVKWAEAVLKPLRAVAKAEFPALTEADLAGLPEDEQNARISVVTDARQMFLLDALQAKLTANEAKFGYSLSVDWDDPELDLDTLCQNWARVHRLTAERKARDAAKRDREQLA